MSQQLQQTIDTAWENRASLSPAAAPAGAGMPDMGGMGGMGGMGM